MRSVLLMVRLVRLLRVGVRLVGRVRHGAGVRQLVAVAGAAGRGRHAALRLRLRRARRLRLRLLPLLDITNRESWGLTTLGR